MTAYNAAINYNSAINYNGGAVSAIIGGHFLPANHKHKRILSNVQVIYSKAQELPRKATKQLRDAISEYVEPAVARQTIVPDIVKVDYESLKANEVAYEKFLNALQIIEYGLMEAEQNRKAAILRDQVLDVDDLMDIATIACLMH